MAKKKDLNFNVNIGGNTTKLSKALEDVNGTINKSQQEVKELNKLSKIDPKNITVYIQKHKSLCTQLTETKKKFTTLKDAEKEVERAFKNGDISTAQYANFREELKKTEKSMKSLMGDALKLGGSLNAIGQGIKDFGGKIAKGIGVGAKAVGIGVGAVTAGVTSATALVETTKEMRNDLNKLEENANKAGLSVDVVNGRFTEMAALTGEADSSVEALSNLLNTGFNENEMDRAINSLSGAVVAFPDTLKIESLSDSLQETIATGKATGQFAELLDRTGVGADKLSEALEGVNDETERQAVALEYLTNTGMAELYDSYQANNEATLKYQEAQVQMQQTMATIAEMIMPLMAEGAETLTDTLSSVVDPISDIIDSFTKMIDGVEGGTEEFAELISNMISEVIEYITDNLPQFFETGIELIGQLLLGIMEKSPEIIGNIGLMLGEMIQSFIDHLPDFLEFGANLVKSIWDGMVAMKDWFFDKISDFFSGIWNSIAGFFSFGGDSGVNAYQNAQANLETGYAALLGNGGSTTRSSTFNNTFNITGFSQNAGHKIVKSIDRQLGMAFRS